MTGNRYFAASNPENRFCPFGRDCLYQHLNEDGTRYVFERGADYYMLVSSFFRPASIRVASQPPTATRPPLAWFP
jgi:hypothetical protein